MHALGMVLVLSFSGFASASCGAALGDATYETHDPCDAAAKHVRAGAPGLRVIYVTSRDWRQGWLVTLQIDRGARVASESYLVTDNGNGTMSVRPRGGRG